MSFKKPVPNFDALLTQQIIKNTGSIKENVHLERAQRQTSITGDLNLTTMKPHFATAPRSPFADCTNQVGNSPLSFFTNLKRKSSAAFSTHETNLKVENDVFVAQYDTEEDNPFRRILSEPIINNNNTFGVSFSQRHTFFQNSTQILIGNITRPYSLPIITTTKDEFVYITPNTLCEVLENRAPLKSHEVVIVDCRYPFEYVGGHIRNSLNIYTKENLINHFFSNIKQPQRQINARAIIFHCEFSKIRGPKMAKFLRSKDRYIHSTKYPELFYPEIYVLSGGYREFYQNFPNFCSPNSYIEMNDPQHALELKFYKRESRSSLKEELGDAFNSRNSYGSL
ncbi:M-phase inducer phosphatase 3 [Thelohanellus kitauei]|uniref:protein-tyrosine-phosphatase n=1 Tax=Thelohanellus kitauei TaxID=669202 RepID=A0A0C2MJS3_THEKT|nr:M-phase inducer phosphatase 3 [Thelohanellus kitauei]